MPAYSQLTILVIDDQQPVRDLIGAMVAALGVERVIRAEDALHAIEQLTDVRPDLIICDYTMPFLSGLDFVAALRLGLTAADPLTPLIMLTADADQQKMRAAAWLQVQEFIRKPVAPATLKARIDHALGNPPQAINQTLDPQRLRLTLQEASRAKACV